MYRPPTETTVARSRAGQLLLLLLLGLRRLNEKIPGGASMPVTAATAAVVLKA